MRVKPSEKLFYNQFTHKVLLREGDDGVDFFDAVASIRNWINTNGCHCKERRSATSLMGMEGDTYVMKGPQKEGLSICFSETKLLEYIEQTYPSLIREVHKIMSDKHADSLTDGVRTRIRPLFQGKFRYKVKFSRFRAQNLGFDLGTMSRGSHLGLQAIGFADAINGEVQDFFLSRTNDLQVVNDWDVTVYCNSASLLTMARLRYDDIITELVQAQPIEELT